MGPSIALDSAFEKKQKLTPTIVSTSALGLLMEILGAVPRSTTV